jgi:RNA polymerase sigma-70 factor (ECF subfamily)
MQHAPHAIDPLEVELSRLMVCYLDGQIEAFDALYAALAPRLRSYLLGQSRDAALADDLVQDTFMQLHRSRHTYEPGRPVTPWVFAIARHVFLMHRRRTGRRVRFEESLAFELSSSTSISDDVRALAERDEVRRALVALPADQRRALLLHHVHGLSFSEIAARLGIRVNAAKTRAFRAMRRLRSQFGTRSEPLRDNSR